jgi:hypothetical protein
MDRFSPRQTEAKYVIIPSDTQVEVEGDPRGPPFPLVLKGGLLIGYTLKHSNTRNGGNGCDARAEGRKASTLRKVEGG